MTIPTENPQATEVGSDEPAVEILISHKKLLTATGGPFELKPELRQLCALTSNGILFVSAQHQTDAYVMAFEDQLEHENHPFEVKVCSMSTIKALYQANEDVNGKTLSTDTKRQAQVVQLLGEATGAMRATFILSLATTSLEFFFAYTDFCGRQSSIRARWAWSSAHPSTTACAM